MMIVAGPARADAAVVHGTRGRRVEEAVSRPVDEPAPTGISDWHQSPGTKPRGVVGSWPTGMRPAVVSACLPGLGGDSR